LFIAWWDKTLDADRVRRVFNGEAAEPLPSEDPTPLDEFTDIAADLTEHHHTPRETDATRTEPAAVGLASGEDRHPAYSKTI
jgi:aerobic C4-dicarboxylate transport protein